MQKTLKTNHITVIIVDGSHEIWESVPPVKGRKPAFINKGSDEENIVIYLNSDYYNTKEALAYGISEQIIRDMAHAISFYKLNEEKADTKAYITGDDLIDLLKQL